MLDKLGTSSHFIQQTIYKYPWAVREMLGDKPITYYFSSLIAHPADEPPTTALAHVSGPVAIDTFGGRNHGEWDLQASVRGWAGCTSLYRVLARP